MDQKAAWLLSDLVIWVWDFIAPGDGTTHLGAETRTTEQNFHFGLVAKFSGQLWVILRNVCSALIYQREIRV